VSALLIFITEIDLSVISLRIASYLQYYLIDAMPNFQYQKVPEDVSNLGGSTTTTVNDDEGEYWTLPRHRFQSFIPNIIIYGVITLSLAVVAFVAGLYTNRDISRKCLKLQSFYCEWIHSSDRMHRLIDNPSSPRS
jgi:hypothetical protein